MRRLAFIVSLTLWALPAEAQFSTRPQAQPTLRTPTAPVQTQPAATPDGDLAFGAYQRGHFLTAFLEATKRIETTPDPEAMTLIAELYANGYGVPQDDAKAISWYELAAQRGDRNALFALGMSYIEGRAGRPRDPNQARPFFEQAAAKGHRSATYNLGIMTLSGQGVPADPSGAARWFQAAADLGSGDAQYAYGAMLKDGNGVDRDLRAAARYMRAAADQDITEAMIEYAIMLFNGQGTPRDEMAAAHYMRRAAFRGNPAAMNRFARMLATGRGVTADPVLAAQWHLLGRQLGANDDWLTDFVLKLDTVQRAAAERGLREWVK